MANARLRKHLQREGGDAAAQTVPQHNYCLIGTPLPALDSKQRDDNEFKPLWEQEVRDEEGRQRFHGAFTGGFSAGYYNTVGSKEGWAPSTFRSSRKDKEKEKSAAAAANVASQSKGKSVGARPEDFMDEEDLADLAQARELQNSKGYDAPSRDPLGGAGRVEDLAEAFSSSILPSSSSIGVTLLKRMGWREGSGMGPRVSAARRRALRAQLGLPRVATEDDADDEEESAKHTYPPPDTPLAHVLLSAGGGRERSNEDLHGLGWQGGVTLEDALRRARTETSVPSVERPGFGIGALEYDSDEDAGTGVYAAGDDIRQSTLGRAGLQKMEPENTKTKGPKSLKETVVPQQVSAHRWGDGSLIFSGFHVATRQQPEDPWFSAEPIPSNWKPNPRRIWATTHSPPPLPGAKDMTVPLPTLLSRALAPRTPASSHMRAEDRAALLGEDRIPGPPPSIFDYLSRKDRERIEAVRNGGVPLAADSTENAPATVPIPMDVHVPPTDPRTAAAALQGFMPYTADVGKATRYQAYLTAQRDASVDLPAPCPPLAPGQTREQLARELADFAKSAAIFRPLSTAMAGRFTSARSEVGAGDGAVVTGGLYQPPPKPSTKEEEENDEGKGKQAFPVEEGEEDDSHLPPSVRAARRGEFGPLTRVVSSFFPHRLLCKRFNVPDPHPERVGDDGLTQPAGADEPADAGIPTSFGKNAPPPRVNEAWDKSRRAIEQLAHGRAWEGAGAGPAAAGNSGRDGTTSETKVKSALTSLENVGLGDDERQGADTLSYSKPGMDIFKAVFADDESDDEDGDAAAEVKSIPAVSAPKPQDVMQAHQEYSIAAPTLFRPTFVPRSQRRADEAEGEGAELTHPTPTLHRSTQHAEEVIVVSSGPARLLEEADAQRRKAARKAKEGEKGEEGKKEKRKRDKKKERAGKGLLTFDLDDEGGGETFSPPDKKKRRKEEESEEVAARGPMSKTLVGPTAGGNRPKASDMF